MLQTLVGKVSTRGESTVKPAEERLWWFVNVARDLTRVEKIQQERRKSERREASQAKRASPVQPELLWLVVAQIGLQKHVGSACGENRNVDTDCGGEGAKQVQGGLRL